MTSYLTNGEGDPFCDEVAFAPCPSMSRYRSMRGQPFAVQESVHAGAKPNALGYLTLPTAAVIAPGVNPLPYMRLALRQMVFGDSVPRQQKIRTADNMSDAQVPEQWFPRSFDTSLDPDGSDRCRLLYSDTWDRPSMVQAPPRRLNVPPQFRSTIGTS